MGLVDTGANVLIIYLFGKSDIPQSNTGWKDKPMVTILYPAGAEVSAFMQVSARAVCIIFVLSLKTPTLGAVHAFFIRPWSICVTTPSDCMLS
jgi:hypothetical protein